MHCFFITLFLALTALTANAQDILNELRRDQSGQGKIVVNQSKEIEQLVNSKPQTTQAAKPQPQTTKPATQIAKPATQTATKPQATKPTTQATKPQTQQNTTKKPAQPKTTNNNLTTETHHTALPGPDTIGYEEPVKEVKTRVVRKNLDTVEADETNEGYVNLNKKVMRHSYKTTGYRVQVYSGGNTRADRQKCQQIAARIKASYPNMPIYVHFYSPSWKCRVGNFTDKGEADSFLKKIKSMGYKTAVLVKGTVSVQY